MPSCFLHQFYAEKIINLVSDDIKAKITNKDLYLIGALGPDPLYFYFSLKGLSLYKKSTAIHLGSIRNILLNIDKNNKNHISFLFGLITHYVFDKNIHKYISIINPKNDLHVLIESELDKRLGIKYYGKRIKFHDGIKYKGLNFNYIPLVYNVSPRQFKFSLFMMRNAISFSMTYNYVKRFIFKLFLIVSFNNKKYKDLQIKKEDDHSIDSYLNDINVIIDSSIKEIIDYFKEFNDYLNEIKNTISLGNEYNFLGEKID